MRAAAVDRNGKMLDKISGVTEFTKGREAVLADIVQAISTLRDRQGKDGLAGVGVGVPGFIRMKEGFITNANNLPYLENFPVRDEISRRLGSPVVLENDANAAALGEKNVGWFYIPMHQADGVRFRKRSADLPKDGDDPSLRLCVE